MATVFSITLLLLFAWTSSFADLTGPSNVCTGVAYGYVSSTVPDGVSVRLLWSYTGSPSVSTPNNYTKNLTWSNAGSVTLTEQEKVGGTWQTVAVYTINVALRSAGTISSNVSMVCSGVSSSITLSNSGLAGTTFSWQSSPFGQNTWTTIGSASPGVAFQTSITQKTDFRLIGDCSYGPASNVVTVDIYSTLTSAGVVAGVSTIWTNTVPPAFTSTSLPVAGGNYYTMKWQKYVSGTWTDIAGATSATYQSGALVANTDFRRLAVWGCGNGSVTMASNTISVATTLPVASSTAVPAIAIGAKVVLQSWKFRAM